MRALFEPVLWWAKRIALIGLALSTAYFYARWQGERADHAATRTAAATAALQSAADAATTTAKLQQDKDRAIQHAATRAQANRTDAVNARTELDRLRNAINASAPDPGANTCTAPTDRASPVGELFSHCAAALTDLAATADRLNTDRLTLLDAWPRPTPSD
jgi:hypothetical protein